jgi:hypothetical protein
MVGGTTDICYPPVSGVDQVPGGKVPTVMIVYANGKGIRTALLAAAIDKDNGNS